MFLEAPSEDETFYVEWLKPETLPYRTERFIDKSGREIKVLVAPSESLDLKQLKNFPVKNNIQSLILTSDEFEHTSREELGEAWEILKNHPGVIWISGSPTDKVRRETLSAYV